MNHPTEQDLLLLAHNQLGFGRALLAQWHISRCKACRKRFTELNSLSGVAAAAMRGGMPAWRPAGMAAQVKLAIMALVIAGGVLVTEVVVANRTPAPVAVPVIQVIGPSCEQKPGSPAAPTKAAPGATKPTTATILRPKVKAQ